MFKFLFDLSIKSTIASCALFFLFWFSLSFSVLEDGIDTLYALLGVKMLSPFITGATALWMVMRD